MPCTRADRDAGRVRRGWLVAPWLVWCAAVAAAPGEVTVIRLTDNVLVQEPIRLGMFMGSDNYYSGGVLRKKRVEANFEGTMYRQCHLGHMDEAGFATLYFTRFWAPHYRGAKYTVLAGKSKGTTGVIRDFTTKQITAWGKPREAGYFVFDKRVEPMEYAGLLVELDRTRDGQIHPAHHYWNVGGTVSIGDVPPGSFGAAALKLDGSQERAHYLFATHYQRFGETNGRWQIHFSAKAVSGSPKLTVRPNRYCRVSADVRLTTAWQRHELALDVSGVPEPKGPKDNPHLLFEFRVTGGAVLVDDVEIWMEGDENPTAFRDDLVRVLQRYRPGVLRYLQMGGSTVDNILSPGLRRFTHTSTPWQKIGPTEQHFSHPFSLPEFYELCEHVAAEPWYCLPGTLHQDEVRNFVEYLAAPANVGYGRLRAKLGHPKPWTEVFPRIHVEFGNEAWNSAGWYMAGGYNGPDYWEGLIAAGKQSPHYRDSILFHAAGQAANPWLNAKIMANVPKADRFSVAPYMISVLEKKHLEPLRTDDAFFRWAFGWPVWRSRNERGAMYGNHQHAQQHNLELSVYEFNHHTTRGDAALEVRNKLVASIGGGLNVGNTMLMMLKEHGIRTQCLFSLHGYSYRAQGVGAVRLWGTCLSMREGRERFRPTFLAGELANKVIAGDLVETVHEGANPTFASTGYFHRRAKEPETLELPSLWSYGFAGRGSRGLIVLNLDTRQDRPIRIAAGPTARPASMWLLCAGRITGHNEYEAGEPQVRLEPREVGSLGPDHTLTLPAHSMCAIAWSVN